MEGIYEQVLEFIGLLKNNQTPFSKPLHHFLLYMFWVMVMLKMLKGCLRSHGFKSFLEKSGFCLAALPFWLDWWRAAEMLVLLLLLLKLSLSDCWILITFPDKASPWSVKGGAQTAGVLEILPGYKIRLHYKFPASMNRCFACMAGFENSAHTSAEHMLQDIIQTTVSDQGALKHSTWSHGEADLKKTQIVVQRINVNLRIQNLVRMTARVQPPTKTRRRTTCCNFRRWWVWMMVGVTGCPFFSRNWTLCVIWPVGIC